VRNTAQPRLLPARNEREVLFLLGLSARVGRFSRWQFPDNDSLHALGTDAASRKILRGGVLYPCQAIFLGRTMPLFPPAVVVSRFTACFNAKDRTTPFVVVERSGVMLNQRITGEERAMLVGLVQVTQRTEESAPLRYLSGEEVAEVLSNTGGYYGRDRSGPIHSRGARRQSAPVNRCHFCRPQKQTTRVRIQRPALTSDG
jgi:hypothetical protein